MPKKKVVEYLYAEGKLILKNPIKNGLDTSRLVNLIICFDSPEEFRIEGFSFPPNSFYIHEVSFNEAVGILIEKFNFDQKKAISKVKEWKKEFGTLEIKKDGNSEQYEKIVVEGARIIDNKIKLTDKQIEEGVLNGARDLSSLQYLLNIEISEESKNKVDQLIEYYGERYK